MTFLTDLGHFQQYITAPELCSHRKSFEIKSLHQKIFSKISRDHLSSPLFKFLYSIIRQKTYLTVPVTGMGIAQNPMALLQADLGCLMLR